MAFGQNIEEIVLQVRAEGKGEADRLAQEIGRLKGVVAGYFGDLANATSGHVGIIKSINDTAKSIKVLEDAFVQLSPAHQRTVQSARDVADAYAKSVQEQAEAARKLAADRIEAGERILAAESLANQRAAAEMEVVYAKLKEMDQRDAANKVEAAALKTQSRAEVVQALREEAAENKLLADSAREAAKAEEARYQAALKSMAEKGGSDRAAAERANADAVVAGTVAVRDQMRAYAERDATEKQAAQDLAAIRARLGQKQAEDHAADQERLRERATRRGEELQEEDRLARRKQANVDAYVDGYKREAQITTLQAHAVRELASEEASLNQVINVGASYTKGRNLDADRTNKYLEEKARLLRRGVSAEDEAADASKRFGYSILHVSHAIQDAQYGFGALLNNIPLVVQAFGGSAGLAGGIMIAGVAMDSLYRHFNKVKGAIVDTAGVHESNLDKMTKDVERLNGAWFRNRDQVKEAEQATRDLADATEAAKIKEMPTEDQASHKRAFEETAKKLPGGAKGVESILQDLYVNQFQDNSVQAIRRGLESGRIPDPQNLMASPERFAQAMDDPRMFRMLKEQWFEKVLPAMIAQTTVGLAKGDVPTFREFMGQASAHPRLGEKDGDQFENKFLRGLQANDPRAIKAQAESERNLEAEQRRNLAAYEASLKAKEDEDMEESRALIIQGKVGEAAFDAAQDIKSKMGAQVKPEKPKRIEMIANPVTQRQQAFRRQQLAQSQGLANEIGFARPDFTGEQAMQAAQMANQTMARMGRNVDRGAAISDAIFRVNNQIMQMMAGIYSRQAAQMGMAAQQGQQLGRMRQPGTSLMPNPMPNFTR